MIAPEEFVFALVERAAVEGRRCPTSDEIGLAMRGADVRGMGPVSVTTRLARAGRLRVEVFAKNYRVITILDGAHAGKSTARHPRYTKPYRVIDGSTPVPAPAQTLSAAPSIYQRRCLDCRRVFETHSLAQITCGTCSTRVIA
jgi:hypothetical protein